MSDSTIVVTGAAGFIGSCVAAFLKENSSSEIVLVDDFSKPAKEGNLRRLEGCDRVERSDFMRWLEGRHPDAVVHLGARTDTTEFDYSIFQELNVDYSQAVWRYCQRKDITLVYASSAATYGDGAFGYKDAHALSDQLQPLNPYGRSKNEFDIWALRQPAPTHWYGLKFFNVYGPNEYHKGRMASVVYHAFHQIEKNKELKLFRSHNEDYKDGEQLRDFIYVKDVCEVILFLLNQTPSSGIYNLGTGKARTFLDLAHAVFQAMEVRPNISFIDTPEDIRDKYQYFTEADMTKLKAAGFDQPFTGLEDGVMDYVRNYLIPGRYF